MVCGRAWVLVNMLGTFIPVVGMVLVAYIFHSFHYDINSLILGFILVGILTVMMADYKCAHFASCTIPTAIIEDVNGNLGVVFVVWIFTRFVKAPIATFTKRT